MSACRRHYPGRFDGTDSLVPFQRRRPSPHYSWVSSCFTSFEACSAFIRVTTCRLAESPYATLYTGGSDGFVASPAAPIATGWNDPVPGRVFHPAVDQRLSRRTVMAMWAAISKSCKPEAANNTMRARSATRTGRDRLRAWDSNRVLSSELNVMAGAIRIRKRLLYHKTLTDG